MNSNDTDSVEASGKAWLYFVVVIVFLVVLMLLFLERLEELRLADTAGQREIEIAVYSFRQLINDLLMVTVIFSLVFSGYLFRLARQISKAGMFPPPGALVLVKTRVLRGDGARRMAIRSYILAALIWLSVLIPIYLEWLLDTIVAKT